MTQTHPEFPLWGAAMYPFITNVPRTASQRDAAKYYEEKHLSEGLYDLWETGKETSSYVNCELGGSTLNISNSDNPLHIII